MDYRVIKMPGTYCLMKRWPIFSSVCAKQEEALFHLYNGRDVFAWFPTGLIREVDLFSPWST